MERREGMSQILQPPQGVLLSTSGSRQEEVSTVLSLCKRSQAAQGALLSLLDFQGWAQLDGGFMVLRF